MDRRSSRCGRGHGRRRQAGGIAQCEPILGIVATGDCSIAAAAWNGGISRIRHVDFKTTSILGVYAEFTTTVHGE